jgi:hypothetical protein
MQWKSQLQEAAAEVFSPGGGNRTSEPAVDVKTLHAKILAGALSKAGLGSLCPPALLAHCGA